jgi:hypothetical protein
MMKHIQMNGRKNLFIVIIGIFILSSVLILFLTKRTEEVKDIRPKASITAYDFALTLNPTDGFTMGQEKTISVIINSGSYQIGSANLNITYNANVLDFVRLEKGNGFSDIIKSSTLPDPPSGNTTIKFIAVVMPNITPTPQKGMVEAMKITFRPRTGNTSALISANAEEITQYNTSLASGSHNLTSNIIETTYTLNILTLTPTPMVIVPSSTPTPTFVIPTATPTTIPCISEGQTGDPRASCCSSDLVKISQATYSNSICGVISGSVLCAKCGNGVCNSYENYCNCPADCPESSLTPTPTMITILIPTSTPTSIPTKTPTPIPTSTPTVKPLSTPASSCVPIGGKCTKSTTCCGGSCNSSGKCIGLILE